MKQILPIIVVSWLILSGCDPYYNISLSNSTKDSITVQFKPNNRFRTAHKKSGITRTGFHVYKVIPKGEIQCGYAIGDLDNDLPFYEIRIIHKKDTIIASNVEDIKTLFDKNTDGKLKIPYNITVRNKKRNKKSLPSL